MCYGRNKSTVCILLLCFIVLENVVSSRVDAKERGKHYSKSPGISTTISIL